MAGRPFREQAVLCTGNEKLSEIGRDLGLLGVPVLFLGSLFERPEVKDLLAFLSLLVDGRGTGLVRVGCWPEFAMAFADVAAVLGHLRSTARPHPGWLERHGEVQGLTDPGRAALLSLSGVLEGFDVASPPWRVLATALLNRTQIAARLGGATDPAGRTRAIAVWQFLNFVRAQPPGPGPAIARLLDRVRRLVRLGDDRDLRHLPECAQGLDAVRLMTVHGAKGLEFPVVHIPGLNADTIPRAAVPPACPPPEGMIAGAEGPAIESFRASHVEEQECIFYVAMSRARDRLVFYAPTEKANGHARPLSKFLERLGGTIDRTQVQVGRDAPAAPDGGEVPLAIEGPLRFGDTQIALFENCPRRFFYTHVLEVGGRRSATAFMQMHEAVRTVLGALIAGGADLPDDELEDRVRAALVEHGLGDHGYRGEFAALALSMLRYFGESRKGVRAEAAAALRLRFGEEEIVVRPDDVLIRPDGARTLRRVRTGHRRSTDGKDVAAAAFLIAAQEAFPDAEVALVHLADGSSQPVTLSARELKGRREKVEGILRDIRAGRFPAKVSQFTCPGCPAFFICSATPEGPLRKKFS